METLTHAAPARRLPADELLRQSSHVYGTLRLVGAPALGSIGRDNPQNVFSVASHSLFGFLSTLDAYAVRSTCREALAAVTTFPWEDSTTRIKGNLALWRACFPQARSANVSGRRDLTNADFVNLRGIRSLDMSNSGDDDLSDAAFAHLRGVRVLDREMWCNV